MAEQLGDELPEVEQALTGGDPQRVGWFRFYFEDQRWEWSEQVQRIHGYEPGTVTPTTELVLSHKHPDDRHHVAATIDDIVRTHKAFSTRHRIIDTGGKMRHVVVVGDQLRDDDGSVIGTHGFYVDITPSERASENIITERVAEIAENRAGIEQAKGMLMLVYDIDDHAAFNLLRWLSQENNIKLRLLAEQIAIDFRAAAPDRITSRAVFDQLLLTAYLRVARPASEVPATR
jgi:PAS domain S-box-containing protein